MGVMSDVMREMTGQYDAAGSMLRNLAYQPVAGLAAVTDEQDRSRMALGQAHRASSSLR